MIKQSTVFFTAWSCVLTTSSVLAYDNFPGDAAWAGDGTNAFLVYAATQRATSLKLDHTGKINDSKLVLNSMILRSAHYREVNGQKYLFQAFIPVVDFDTAKVANIDQNTKSGVGDLTFEAAWFPIVSDDPKGVSVTTGLYLGTPTGVYDVNKVSAGAGLWSMTPEVGIIKGLGNQLFFESTISGTFYKNDTHDSIEVKKDPAYKGQFNVRYQLSPVTYLGAGITKTFGGKNYLDGNYVETKTESTQVRAFYNHIFTNKTLVGAMVARDLTADGGYKQDYSLMLRFAKFY